MMSHLNELLRDRTRPLLMGIVNVTGDSFSEGARSTPATAVDRALALLDDGADLLDIGGESTRPGAAVIPADEEAQRVVPVVRELRKLRSSIDENLIYPIDGWEQDMNARCEKGSLLRPFVVFFGESVPMFERATQIAATADILVIIGTSLAVYPAASLVRYVRPEIPVYVVDPGKPELAGIRNPVEVIRMKAAEGMPILAHKLIEKYGH